jgi:hypothetical protein
MQIVTQTSDELVLKEGDFTGFIFGIVFVIVGGLGLWYYLNSAGSVSSVVMWVAIAFVSGGLGSIFFSSSITVDIQKTNSQIIYQKKRLIGGKTEAYTIGDVLQIETRREWRAGTSGNQGVSVPQLMMQSVIVFKDGRELALDHQKGSSSMGIGAGVLLGGRSKEVSIANAVATFLSLPFQEIAPPGGIGATLSGGGIQL